MTLAHRIRTCFLLFLIQLLAAPVVLAADSGGQEAEMAPYQVAAIGFEQSDQGFLVSVQGQTLPTYTIYELFDPLRVVLDIANASFAEDLSLPMTVEQGPVARVGGRILADKEPYIAKLEIFLNQDQSYTVERQDNNIRILFSPRQEKSVESSSQTVSSPSMAPARQVHGISVRTADGASRILVQADGPLEEYSKVELDKSDSRPHRMYIDLQDTEAMGLDPLTEVGGGSSLARIRTASRDDGLRIVFDSALDSLFDYTIEPDSQGLLITIANPEPMEPISHEVRQQKPAAGPDPVAGIIDSIAKESTASTSQPATNSGRDKFRAAGYEKQKISVDFYKIDLHNVFRMFGEISGSNMIIDQEVAGTLTLALNEVPWDFAMDVILNLKDLKKEERFNTIVISPKGKQFSWPKEPKEELEIVAPPSDVAIAIEEQLDMPEGMMEAKKLMHKAGLMEREGDRKGALAAYEQAFLKWPENGELARRISTSALVDFGMNAKALHYAKAGLELNSTDYEAALLAGIAAANMRKPEAADYFAIAVSPEQPSQEALVSSASFQEEQQQYGAALDTLARAAKIYGDNLETMVARARILDKNGQSKEADAEYLAILYSGYGLDPDLERYIRARVGAN